MELALTDSAKASNYELAPGPFAAQAAISYGSVALEADEASFTLLRDGAEDGLRPRLRAEGGPSETPRVVDLPTGERRVLSATAGVLGSVRQNVKWGHYCKVAFRVEFLDAQGRLIGDAFQTQTHGWKHEAEDIELARPRPGRPGASDHAVPGGPATTTAHGPTLRWLPWPTSCPAKSR